MRLDSVRDVLGEALGVGMRVMVTDVESVKDGVGEIPRRAVKSAESVMEGASEGVEASL